MRISQQAKEETRENILEAAKKLFLKNGYDETTTRDIASHAGLAAGTMFNYFPGKETLAMTLAAKALEGGRRDYYKRSTGEENLEESLFLLITSELRRLKPLKSFIGPVLEITMSQFSKAKNCPVGESVRLNHLKTVEEIISANNCNLIPGYIASSLYWSLYLGILAFWIGDNSRKQEETLALIDYSLKVFIVTIIPLNDNGEINYVGK